MKARQVAAWILVLGVGACTLGVVLGPNTPSGAALKSASDQPKQDKPSRDDYGNLVVNQSTDGYGWTYSGPDDQIDTTRSVLTRLLKRCPALIRNRDEFDKVTASYSKLTKERGLEQFAGKRLVFVSVAFAKGWLTEPGLTSMAAATYVTMLGKNRDVAADPAGAFLCGVPIARTGLTHLTLPASTD